MGAAVDRRREAAPAGMALCAEALHLLGTAPRPALAAYAAGTLPCALGALFFWADMSRSAFAHRRCLGAAMGLAALFLWMKSWQCVAAGRMLAFLGRRAAPAWTWRRCLRMIAVQSAAHVYGLLALPLALVALAPFPSVYAFFQNVTVLGSREDGGLRALAGRAWTQALLWGRQNAMVVWMLCPWTLAVGILTAFGSMRLAVSSSVELQETSGPVWFGLALVLTFWGVLPLSPFGCAVAGNIALAALFLPGILKGVFDIETPFSLTGWQAIFNSTYLFAVFAIAYVCMDALAKAAYCLRCYHGEALRSGEDLLSELSAVEGAEGPP